MPNVKVLNMLGEEVGEVTLSDAIFARNVNEVVLHTAVRAYLMNQRQGTQSTLTRSEVSGGGRKPWKQKGTGRARQGSIRSPQWTHGGIVFAPKPRDYRVTLNKKTKRVALFSALSAKVAEGNLIVLDEIKFDEYKTTAMIKMFRALGAQKEVEKTYKTGTKDESTTATRTEKVDEKALLVLDNVNKFVVKSCSNIETVKTTLYSTLSVYDILHAEKFIITKDALTKLEEVYA